MPQRILRAAAVMGCALFIAPAAAAAQGIPPVPPADTGANYWTCKASVATVTLGSQTFDPLHANTLTPNNRCRDDSATAPTANAQDVLGVDTLSLSGNALQAQTGLTNSLSLNTYDQAPGAVAQGGNIDLKIGGPSAPGTLEVTGHLIRSYVSAHCVNGAPLLESGNSVQYPSGKFPDGSPVGGEVADLRINGTAIPADGQPDETLQQIANGLAPLAPIIKITLNKVYNNGTSITREAVRIEALTAPGSKPVLTVVIGSATVGYNGDVCHVPAGTPPGTPGTPGGPSVSPPSFPPGGNEPGSNGGGGGANSNAITGEKVVFIKGATITRAPNGSNASECAHLRMFYDLERNGRISNHGPTSLTGTIGVRHVVRGFIRNCKGRPIINAKIALVNIIHGKRHLVKTGLRSRGKGKLTIILPNNLTTRTLVFQYRAFSNDLRIAARATLHLRVRNHKGRVI